MPKLNVLLTGAAGQMGRHLTPAFEEAYNLRVFDVRPVPGAEDVVNADLTDPGALKSAMTNIDVVVHLAAAADDAPLAESLVPNNVIGLHNVFEAARAFGVRRIVFASSGQTVTNHPPEHRVEISDPVRPASLHAATKIFGEAVGRYYHDLHGIEFVAIRIGEFEPAESPRLESREARALWLSPRDAIELFRLAIEKPGIGFAIVFGTSRTTPERLSLRAARELLGYEPRDSIVAAGASAPGAG